MTRRFRSRRAITLALVLLAVCLVPLAAHADSFSGKDLNTQRNFHLTTSPLELCFNRDERAPSVELECVGQETNRNIYGNLFTFTHPSTPNEAKITSMTLENKATVDHPGRLSGEFTIEVALPQCVPDVDVGPCSDFAEIDGEIYVSFNSRAEFVEKVGEEPTHFNFEGPFKIVGGSGFYSDIKGEGTIGGTFHRHRWGDGENETWRQSPWFDFVMIGASKFR